MIKNVTPIYMWSLKLSKESFKFSGAHFTTFSKTSAEQLHGHNYYVTVCLEGCESLTHGMVTDLNQPKKQIKSVLKKLDEKVLIAKSNPYTKIATSNDNTTLNFNDKMYSFPTQDCVQLAVENITIEALSKYLADELESSFKLYPIQSYTVEVAESRGQSAVYSKTFSNTGSSL